MARYQRVHRKVWVAWGRWWAIQLQMNPTVSLGIRFEFRPLLDLYLGPLTVAIGRHPLRTDERARYADSCRGFFFEGEVL